jgi:hypothetical protein
MAGPLRALMDALPFFGMVADNTSLPGAARAPVSHDLGQSHRRMRPEVIRTDQTRENV